jgi:membrane protein DedA with SNARE-associated domain
MPPLHGLLHLLRHLVHAFPLPGLFLLVTIEEAGVPLPLPGDVLLVLAGTQAERQPAWYSLLVVGIATAAVFVGSSLLFLLMRRGGRPLLQRAHVSLHLNPRRLARIEGFFRQRGHLAILVGRLIPGMRIPTTVVVGLVGVPYRTYAGLAALTALLWSAGYFWLGVFLGRHGRVLAAFLERVDDLPKRLLALGILLALASVGGSVWQLHRHRHRVAPRPAERQATRVKVSACTPDTNHCAQSIYACSQTSDSTSDSRSILATPNQLRQSTERRRIVGTVLLFAAIGTGAITMFFVVRGLFKLGKRPETLRRRDVLVPIITSIIAGLFMVAELVSSLRQLTQP